MARTPEQMATSWANAMASPQTKAKYIAGIEATTVNPMELAASDAAQQRYLSGTSDAVESGRMAAKLRGVPKQRWTDNSKGEGANRLAGGGAKARQKVLSHFQKWGPIYEQARQAARAIKDSGGGPLERIRAAINVMMQAANKPQI